MRPGTIPVVVISGESKSGKDTLGAYAAERYNGTCIAQADPIKLLAREIFGFDEQTLWGPSDARNVLHTKWSYRHEDGQKENWAQAHERMHEGAKVRSLVNKLFPASSTAFDTLRSGWWTSAKRQATEAGGLSARWVLQTLGTEWARSLNHHIWTDYAVDTAINLLCGGYTYRDHQLQREPGQDPSFVAITDGRFKNELIKARSRGCLTLEVVRPGNDGSANAFKAGIAGHQSETELKTVPAHFYDFVVHNDGTLDQLYNKTEDVIEDVLKPYLL